MGFYTDNRKEVGVRVIPGLDLTGATAQFGFGVGVVLLVVVALLRGTLRPQSSVDREQRHLEARLAEKDLIIKEQRETIRAQDQRNDELAKQVGRLTEIGRTANAALSSLPLPQGSSDR